MYSLYFVAGISEHDMLTDAVLLYYRAKESESGTIQEGTRSLDRGRNNTYIEGLGKYWRRKQVDLT